jgi:hypothetical protein
VTIWRRGRSWRSLVIAASTVILGSTAFAASAAHAYARYPDSIAVLGHSGATGENSDPSSPGLDVRANSWATGTNPEVDSVYLRILARHPAIADREVNLAEGGATVQRLVAQAREAVSLTPLPELFLIQIMDNDIVCPAAATDLQSFRSNLVTALGILMRGAPGSRVFVTSQFGSPGTFAASLSSAERTRFARQAGFGAGPCDFIDQTGRIVPNRLARLDRVTHGYEAQLAAGCRRFTQCTYDGGAFGRVVDRRRYVSSDLNHFSIAGHAEAAAVAWAAMQRAGVVPHDAP